MKNFLYALYRLKRRIGNIVRRKFWQAALENCGYECSFCKNLIIMDPRRVTIGNRVKLNEGVIINARPPARVAISDGVTLSYSVMILTAGIKLEVYPSEHAHYQKDVIIHENVWIGAGAIIMPGVTIGARSIVGAGAVVTKAVTSGTIVAGVPAKVIKGRDLQE